MGKQKVFGKVGLMLCYKDKSFCVNSNDKCGKCDRYFDKQEYDKFCAKCGTEMYVSWIARPDNCPQKTEFENSDSKQIKIKE